MIVVLGASGFLGSAFVRQLAAVAEPYVAVTRANYVEHVGRAYDLLVNAAGNSRKYLADRDPAQEFELSVVSVLRALRGFRPRRYVHVSSVDVYNDPSTPARSAETATIEPHRLSAYGFSKYVAELVARRYAPDCLVVRLGGMVGPGLSKNPVYDLLQGSPLYVHPDSQYQYLATDTVAQIVLDLAATGDAWGQTFNLCGRNLVRIRDVVGWVGLTRVEYLPGSVPERYEVNIDKIAARYHIPDSVATVRAFVDAVARETGAPPERRPAAQDVL